MSPQREVFESRSEIEEGLVTSYINSAIMVVDALSASIRALGSPKIALEMYTDDREVSLESP